MDENASIKRRLAAILAADIAGYCRLMGEDEAGTVRDLKSHQAVILPLVARHGGRVVDTAGDGILVEFPSVIGAIACAVEIQRVVAARNEAVPKHRRMLFRMGINLGDVIHDETRIYGDGINVAARLEGLAEPGGVLVSQAVREQARDHPELVFGDGMVDGKWNYVNSSRKPVRGMPTWKPFPVVATPCRNCTEECAKLAKLKKPNTGSRADTAVLR